MKNGWYQSSCINYRHLFIFYKDNTASLFANLNSNWADKLNSLKDFEFIKYGPWHESIYGPFDIEVFPAEVKEKIMTVDNKDYLELF